MRNPKVILTGGCSYTESLQPVTSKNKNWPVHLHNYTDVPTINTGQGGSDNTMIARRLIFQLSNLLKEFEPKDILVGVMWSGPSRKCIPLDNVIDDVHSGYPISWLNGTAILDNKTDTDWHRLLCLDNNFMTYRTMNAHQEENTSKLWYRYFQNDVDDMIVTLENIIRVQSFLKLHGIKYFMCAYTNYVLDNDVMRSNKLEIKSLNRLVDYEHFLPINGADNWILSKSQYKDVSYINGHPTTEQMKDFTDRVIIPHLITKGYIYERNQ